MTGPDLSSARFYAILDTGYVDSNRWPETCRQLITGGADLIQLRAKKESADRRRELLETILPLFEPAGTPPLIVNDDIDLCLEYPELGLHVGQEDLPAAEARERLGPDRILGLSTHSVEQARGAISLADQLSYFAVGPVFATPTKPDYAAVGLDLVRRVAELRPARPFFCIGGIKRDNVREVLNAGAERIVVVSDVLEDSDPAGVVRTYRDILPAA